MEAMITVLPGDGIGPEVARSGIQALSAVADVFGHRFDFSEQLIGGAAIDQRAVPAHRIADDADGIAVNDCGQFW